MLLLLTYFQNKICICIVQKKDMNSQLLVIYFLWVMFKFSSFQMIVNSVNFFDVSKRCLSKEMSSPYLWMSTSRRYVLMTCHISLVSHPQLYQNLTATIIVLISRASLTFTFWYSQKLLNCIYQYIVLSWMFVWKCRFAIKQEEPRKFWSWPYFTLGTMTNTWQGKLLN